MPPWTGFGQPRATVRIRTQRGYVDTLRFKYDETTEENKALRASFEIFLANRNATSEEVCL